MLIHSCVFVFLMFISSPVFARSMPLMIPACAAPFDIIEGDIFRLIKAKANPNYLLIIIAGTNGWEWILINDLKDSPAYIYGFEKNRMFMEMGSGKLDKELAAIAVKVMEDLWRPFYYDEIKLHDFYGAGDPVFLLASNTRFQTQLWRKDNAAAIAASRLFIEIRSFIDMPKLLDRELPSLW